MSSNDFSAFQASGIVIEGVKYQFLRGDPEMGLAIGKKKDNGSLTLQTSNTAVVITHTAEGQTQGISNNGTNSLCEYLISQNY